MSSHKTFPNQLGCKELPSPGFIPLFVSLEILIDALWNEPSFHVCIFLFLHYTAIGVIFFVGGVSHSIKCSLCTQQAFDRY